MKKERKKFTFYCNFWGFLIVGIMILFPYFVLGKKWDWSVTFFCVAVPLFLITNAVAQYIRNHR